MSVSRPGTNKVFRQIHRWVGLVAVILFLSVTATGILLQTEQIFGAKEAQKEHLATLTSPVSLESPLEVDQTALERARVMLLKRLGKRPVDGVDWQIKGDDQLFVFRLGGTDPIDASVDVRSSQVVKVESGEEDLLLRLHSGEALGDGGKLLGLFWGIALILMIVSGLGIYWQLREARRRSSKARSGWRSLFWAVLPFLVMPLAVDSQPARNVLLDQTDGCLIGDSIMIQERGCS